MLKKDNKFRNIKRNRDLRYNSATLHPHLYRESVCAEPCGPFKYHVILYI